MILGQFVAHLYTRGGGSSLPKVKTPNPLPTVCHSSTVMDMQWKRERERECVCVCVCERECVCVCV